MMKNPSAVHSERQINSQNPIPPTLDDPCFDQSSYASVALTVPQQSIDAYKAAAEWNEFNNINGYGAVDAVNADGKIKINGREIAVNDSNAFVEIYGLSGNTVYTAFLQETQSRLQKAASTSSVSMAGPSSQ